MERNAVGRKEAETDMSLTSKQIDELRSYAKDRKGELAKMINDAADTIELLSAKLSAANMERSTQYYNDGWIPFVERMPAVNEQVWLTIKGSDCIAFQDGESIEDVMNRIGKLRWVTQGYLGSDGWYGSDGWPMMVTPIAWMPIKWPEPWRGLTDDEINS